MMVIIRKLHKITRLKLIFGKDFADTKHKFKKVRSGPVSKVSTGNNNVTLYDGGSEQ